MRSRGDKSNSPIPTENENKLKTSLLDDVEQKSTADGDGVIIEDVPTGRFARFKRRAFQFFCGCSKRNRILIWSFLIGFLVVGGLIGIITWLVVDKEDLFFCSTNDYSCYSKYIRDSCASNSKACFTTASKIDPLEAMPVNLTVVMFADSTVTANARLVFNMSIREQPDLILHAGDFDYLGSPAQWESFLNSTIGPSYPFFAAVGNHDDPNYYSENGYQQDALKRLKGVNGDLHCLGDLGVKTVCTWKGLTFVLAAPGTEGTYHANFIEASFGVFRSKWNIAVWHKNQNLMQLGDKSDEAGWDVYETSRKAGAIVFTGHEHSYCRTKLMTDFTNQVYVDQKTNITIKPGQTIMHVTGTGGRDIRPCNSKSPSYGWWASAYCTTFPTDDPLTIPGITVCKFNFNGNADQAYCYFKGTDGKIRDEYYLSSEQTPTNNYSS